jgi:hypothetical protein
MIIRAEGGYKITQEEVKEKAMNTMQKGTLRDFNQDYWARFIKGGELDKEALVAAGYDGPGEADNIEKSMVKLGWIGDGDKAVDFVRDPAYVSPPLPLSERKQAEKEAAEAEAKAAKGKKAEKEDVGKKGKE